MFGIVSTGTSSIAIDLTYDRKRLDEAINKITGSGLKPTDIIEQRPTGADGPSEVRYRAHVAFCDRLRHAEQPRSRCTTAARRSSTSATGTTSTRLQGARDGDRGQRRSQNDQQPGPISTAIRATTDYDPFKRQGAAVHRRRPDSRARRADAPGEPRQRDDLHDRPARARGRRRHRRAGRSDGVGATTSGSRRTACACSPSRRAASPSSTRTTSTKALKRIDAETSDYYVLGYYSTNMPDREAQPEARREDQAARRISRYGRGTRTRSSCRPRRSKAK